MQKTKEEILGQTSSQGKTSEESLRYVTFRFRFAVPGWLVFLMSAALVASLALWLSGCTTPPSPTSTVQDPYTKPSATPGPVSSAGPGAPASELPRPIKGWPKAYSDFIWTQVPQSLLAVKKIDFCPAYGKFSEAGKRSFWATALQGIAKPESGWDRTNQYVETKMGIDPITGQRVRSEGLLQLSYQDSKNYQTPFCKSLDWSEDKKLPLAERAITDPYLNLGCGLEISERLMRLHNDKSGAVYALGRYWSTMRRGKCEARRFIRENTECGKEPDGC